MKEIDNVREGGKKQEENKKKKRQTIVVTHEPGTASVVPLSSNSKEQTGSVLFDRPVKDDTLLVSGEVPRGLYTEGKKTGGPGGPESPKETVSCHQKGKPSQYAGQLPRQLK